MANISSLGIGSGLDINSLVSELVAAERSTKDSRLARTDARLTTEFTALATLKGAMSGMLSAANGLRTPAALALSRATVADDKYFTATTSAQAVAGRYEVQVTQLAAAARLGSGAYPDGPDSIVGTGTLDITVGGTTFSVAVAEGGNTLAQLRDAINAADGNTGLRATIIRDTDGSHLVLSGLNTGAANAISVSASGADAGLQQLADSLNDFDADHDVAARDAIAFVSGYEIRSASNTLTGAIEGITLALKQVTAPGESIALTIDRDDAAIQKKVEGFVTAWNSLAQQIATLGRYDAATQTAGPMLGDSLLRGVDSQLRRMLTEPVPGTQGDYRTLSSLGISITARGALELDAAKLQQAMAADPAAVQRLFSGESGVAVRMGDYLEQRLASSGEFAARNDRIDSQRRRLDQERQALDQRMLVVQQRYLKQFTAMDSMLAQLQSTSSYLTQQLEGLANLAGGSRR